MKLILTESQKKYLINKFLKEEGEPKIEPNIDVKDDSTIGSVAKKVIDYGKELMRQKLASGTSSDNSTVTPTVSLDSKGSGNFGDIKVSGNYSNTAKNNISLLIDELKKQGITNNYAIVGILSTIGKESGFIPKNEVPYNNTGNDRIRMIFGKRVSGLSDAELTSLKKNPEKFWDRVYGYDDPTGNSQKYGNNQPGDGAKYLGRGFNGITFKSGYKKYSQATGIDLVSNPELLNDPAVAAKAAVAYFINGFKAKGVDPNSYKDVSSAIKDAVHINAGLGANIEGSMALSSAQKVSNNFDIS